MIYDLHEVNSTIVGEIYEVVELAVSDVKHPLWSKSKNCCCAFF